MNITKRVTEVDIKVGQRIRTLRHDKGVSQTDLANELGLTFQQVQKYEKGTNRISVGRLLQMCRYFDLNVEDFLDGIASRGRRNKATR